MNIRDKYKELTGEFATHYQGISDEFTEDYKKWLEQQVEKLFDLPVVSVAKHTLPRPLEAYREAQNKTCGEYVDWFLKEEKRGNAL